MIATVFPSVISGQVKIPASKSAMQRACALALLNNGETKIYHPGSSQDDLTALRIIAQMGASVTSRDDIIIIKSDGLIKPDTEINCGESGLSFRMFAPIAALSSASVKFTGDGSLMKRPMPLIGTVFPLLHVTVRSNNGFLPIQVQGPLVPADISIDASGSSQYLTGLLFALAKAAKERITINVTNLKSKPYIGLSLAMLEAFGFRVRHEGYTAFFIDPADNVERNREYVVEGDWSSASFLMVAGAVAGSVTITGLDMLSVQGDKAILLLIGQCGAGVDMHAEGITIRQSAGLKSFDFDATECPDLFPPLVALAVHCKGESVIRGVSRLAFKESDRAKSIKDVFEKMGHTIHIEGDIMRINGGQRNTTVEVGSHDDHRIVMAAAVTALTGEGPVTITGAEAIDKSYPGFFKHLKMLGASVSLMNESIMP